MDYNSLYSENKDLHSRLNVNSRLLRLCYHINNKKKFIIMDLILISAFLFNIGAMGTANYLQSLNNPDVVYIELNPVVAESAGYLTSEKAPSKFNHIVLKLKIYSYMILIYLILRYFVNADFWYILLLSWVIMNSFVLFYDFGNDAAYFLGEVMRT